MAEIVEFKKKEKKMCDICFELEGEYIEGIGINKVIPNPYDEKEMICLDCKMLLEDIVEEEF